MFSCVGAGTRNQLEAAGKSLKDSEARFMSLESKTSQLETMLEAKKAEVLAIRMSLDERKQQLAEAKGEISKLKDEDLDGAAKAMMKMQRQQTNLEEALAKTEVTQCSLNHARCSLNHAACSLNHARCSLNHAGCSLNHAQCSLTDAKCSLNDTECCLNDAERSLLLPGDGGNGLRSAGYGNGARRGAPC
jgi:chromosome segregation ATPase